MESKLSSWAGGKGREKLLPMSRAVEEADTILLVFPGLKFVYHLCFYTHQLLCLDGAFG